MPEIFTPNVLQLGISCLLLAALVIYSRSQQSWIKSEKDRWSAEITLREKKNQSDKEIWEKKGQNDKEMLTSLIEKNYTILTSVMNDSREQIQAITRLVERIKTMQTSYDQAFHDLFAKHDGHDKDRCIYHIKEDFKRS